MHVYTEVNVNCVGVRTLLSATVHVMCLQLDISLVKANACTEFNFVFNLTSYQIKKFFPAKITLQLI